MARLPPLIRPEIRCSGLPGGRCIWLLVCAVLCGLGRLDGASGVRDAVPSASHTNLAVRRTHAGNGMRKQISNMHDTAIHASC